MSFEEKTIESDVIYKGQILTLRKDKVHVRDGKTAYREIIEHRGAVAILPITNEGKVILVEQYRKAAEKSLIEIPAGKMEGGEDPLETAKRELEEETGYQAENIEFMTKIYPAVGYSGEKIYIYRATGLKKGKTNFDEDEDIETIEMPIEEITKLVLAGKIEDSKTIIAILMEREKQCM